MTLLRSPWDKAQTGYAQTASLSSLLSSCLSLFLSPSLARCRHGRRGMTAARSGMHRSARARARTQREARRSFERVRLVVDLVCTPATARLRENYDVVAVDGSVNFSRIRCRLLLPLFSRHTCRGHVVRFPPLTANSSHFLRGRKQRTNKLPSNQILRRLVVGAVSR